MRYSDFRLVEGYREVEQKFSQTANPDTVKQIIDQFRDLVNRNQVQGNERNIDWWGKQGWDRFSKFVSAKSQQQSITQQKKRKSVGKSHNLAENDEWLIVIPLDKDASCFHGKGTDWCTTKPDHDYFHQYFLNNKITLIYFLQKQTGKKWAITAKENGDHDYFDINDNILNPEQFSSQTGINPEKYINMAIGPGTDANKKVDKSRTDIQARVDKMFQLLDQFTKGPSGVRDPELENYIVKGGSQGGIPASEIYLKHLLKKPVELDSRMQRLFVKMWDADLEYSPEDQIKTIKNVTNLSTENKLKILSNSRIPLEGLFGDEIPNEIQEKILDADIFYIKQTDAPLKDRHINEVLQIILTPPIVPSHIKRKKEFTEQLLNRADYDKIVNNLQGAIKSILDGIKGKGHRTIEYSSSVLNRLKQFAEKIDYNPAPILDWAVETYDIDYIN
jgi:hypothetical protein